MQPTTQVSCYKAYIKSSVRSHCVCNVFFCATESIGKGHITLKSQKSIFSKLVPDSYLYIYIYIHMWAGAKGGREERTTKNICCVGLAFIVCIVSVWVCDDLGQCFLEFKFVRGWFGQM